MLTRIMMNTQPRGRRVSGLCGLVLCLAIFSAIFSPAVHAVIEVDLQLKWHHQFQFAGYYAAKAQGFYRDEGLQVHIAEGGAGKSALANVLNGGMQFGVGDSDIVLAHMRGQPVVALAAIFQHSPYIILSRHDSHIRAPTDLVGKRIMLSDRQGAAQFNAMLLREGINAQSIQVLPHSWNLDDLIEGRVDAMSAYATVEPAQLRRLSVKPAMLSSKDYGVDFYGDTLFTSAAEASLHPQRVEAFLRASRKGWRYALDHPHEIADLILAMPGVVERGITHQLLLQEAESMRPFILPDVVEIGHMNSGRWQHIAETYASLGIAPPTYDLEGFIYAPPAPLSQDSVRWLVGFVVVSMMGTGFFMLWNLQIRRRVQERTLALQTEVSHRKQVEADVVLRSKQLENTAQLLRDSEERYRRSAQSLAKVFDSSLDVICTIDADGNFVQLSAACEAIWGYTAQELAGTPYMAKVLPQDHEMTIKMAAAIMSGKPTRNFENRYLRKDGSITHIMWSAQWSPADQVMFAVARDVTERKAAEQEIHELAFYDPLTKLPNRLLLMARLQQVLATCMRKRETGALLFIDLDNFKTLNDTLGHDIGDLLLQQVASRILACVRESDTVARLGGDEFVVVLSGMSENTEAAAGQVKKVGEQILGIFDQPFVFQGYEYHSTPSIGIAMFSDGQDTLDDLLKRADLAMYQAKAGGRNTMRFFDPEMQQVVSARVTLEASLRLGLQQREFILHYQPQMGNDNRITGVEALVRWLHPQRGLVPPVEFIPLAEDTGLILPLGLWVLQTACAQLALWSAQAGMDELELAVNVSARQFRHADFVDQVLTAIDSSGIRAHKLKLELTESMLLENVEEIIVKMNVLKHRGVQFSLDDFGTGYSSLSYLRRLPLHQLKIDRSFVRDMLSDVNGAAITRTVIALGQSLNLNIIAEGVETEEQRAFLAQNGCQAYQGYLLSPPLPIDELEPFILSHY